MAGINRALISGYDRIIYENKVIQNNSKVCVFISHKSSDMDAAEAVARYLMQNNIDVYLDKKDADLQKKTKEKDTQGIVDSIEKALKCSTHILVLVSDQTKESWWVPYEVGYSKKGKKKIASALLVGYVDDFPDYLKIEETIKSPDEFKTYAQQLKRLDAPYGTLFENAGQNVSNPSELESYIRRIV